MRSHFERDLFRKNRNLRRQQSADAKRRGGVSNAGFPIAGVGTQLAYRIEDLPLQFGDPRFRLFPVLGNKRANQIGLSGEMVVDAGVADADHFGDVGIAEASGSRPR